MLALSKYQRWLLVVFLFACVGQAFAHGMSEAEKLAIMEGGNLSYIWIGATHMLSGYDHLAFVFGIVFFLTKFSDIVKYITAFTVGHSITLIWATFQGVQVNYFLIDAVIALSVCYIAFQNLGWFKKFLNIDAPNMLVVIFVLGLIHGLGLSTRLQQLPLNPDSLLMNIISFNIGIELGQIAALAVMLLLITAFRKRHAFEGFSRLANGFLIAMGAYLFFFQMHGYEHSVNAEELASTSTGNHQSMAVENMAKQDWTDQLIVVIPARSGKEYKLEMAKGANFEYAWKTDGGELMFDLHAERKGDTSGYFKRFARGIRTHANGSVTSEFEGPHGWHWKNSKSKPAKITLYVRGDYQRFDTTNNNNKK